MKRLLIVGLVMLVACSAFAAGNPNVTAYIDFDPPNQVHAYMPAPYETFNAYICFGGIDMGLTSASFMVTNVTTACPGVFAPPSFTNILPGDLAIGNIFTGITIASTGCEAGPDVCVGYLTLFYIGGSCCIEILDHPDYPRWITDCNDPAQVDYYCLLSNGSVGGAECPEGDCGSPVEDTTWGGIKALYR
jgi:hypothetical protein